MAAEGGNHALHVGADIVHRAVHHRLLHVHRTPEGQFAADGGVVGKDALTGPLDEGRIVLARQDIVGLPGDVADGQIP